MERKCQQTGGACKDVPLRAWGELRAVSMAAAGVGGGGGGEEAGRADMRGRACMGRGVGGGLHGTLGLRSDPCCMSVPMVNQKELESVKSFCMTSLLSWHGLGECHS